METVGRIDWMAISICLIGGKRGLLLNEIILPDGNKFRIYDDKHFDYKTDELVWHGIQIQRLSKDKKGVFRYRETLNVPYTLMNFINRLSK